MPITIDETIIPLAGVPKERGIPRRRRGRPIHMSCVYRWTTVGCRGVLLESIQVGGTRCTSREALQRFFEALSSRHARPAGANQPGPGAGRRTIAQRQRRSAEAGRKLAELGA